MFLGKFRDAPSLEDIPQRSSNSTFVICRVVVFLAPAILALFLTRSLLFNFFFAKRVKCSAVFSSSIKTAGELRLLPSLFSVDICSVAANPFYILAWYASTSPLESFFDSPQLSVSESRNGSHSKIRLFLQAIHIWSTLAGDKELASP